MKRLSDISHDTKSLIDKITAEINAKNQEIEKIEQKLQTSEKENSDLKMVIEEMKEVLNEKNSVITEYETEVKEIERMKTRLIEIVQKRKDHDRGDDVPNTANPEE